MAQTTADPMPEARRKAEERAGKKQHRFTERSWHVDGDGLHRTRCSTPGCRAEIQLKKEQYFGRIIESGSAFSSNCPKRE